MPGVVRRPRVSWSVLCWVLLVLILPVPTSHIMALPVVLGYFETCLNSERECLTTEFPGHYPVCGDCTRFLKCDVMTSSAAVIQCPPSLLYDVTLGVCNFAWNVKCTAQTTQTAPRTSPSSSTSSYSSSTLSQTSLTSSSVTRSTTTPTTTSSTTSSATPTTTSSTTPTTTSSTTPRRSSAIITSLAATRSPVPPTTASTTTSTSGSADEASSRTSSDTAGKTSPASVSHRTSKVIPKTSTSSASSVINQTHTPATIPETKPTTPTATNQTPTDDTASLNNLVDTTSVASTGSFTGGNVSANPPADLGVRVCNECTSDGFFGTCDACSVYYLCREGKILGFLQCQGSLVWDDDLKSCQLTSFTCPATERQISFV